PEQRLARVGGIDFLFLVATLGTDDAAFGQEQVADLLRRLEQPTRVVTQVEYQPARPFLLHLIDRLTQLLGRRLGEAGQPDVADLGSLVDHEVPLLGTVRLTPIAQDAGDLDLRTNEGDVLRLARFVTDTECDLLAGLARNQLDGLAEAHALGRLAIDLEDDVP